MIDQQINHTLTSDFQSEDLKYLTSILKLGDRLDATALSALAHVLHRALEGARIQKVRDPEKGSIALKLRVPARSYYLTLQSSLDRASLTIGYERPSTLPSPTGIGRWVRAHLEGTKLVQVRQVQGDRILVFDFMGKTPQKGEPVRGGSIYIEMIPSLYNLYAVDVQGMVRAWVTRVPARELHLGRPWLPPPQPEGFKLPKKATWPLLTAEEARALIEPLMSQMQGEQPAHLEPVGGEARARNQIIKQTRNRLKRLITALWGDLERAEQAEEWRQQAELLKSQLGSLKRGMISVKVTNWFDPELGEIEIPLDPTRDGKENMQRLFQRQRKAVRGSEIATERLLEAEKQLERFEELVAALSESPFEELRSALRGEGLLKERIQGGKNLTKNDRKPYRVFWSGQGEMIWVGRGGQDNHQTSFQQARGQDLWLHTRDAPGAHVIIPLPHRGHQPHLETIRDAAALAVHHSPLRGEQAVELYLTERKHIRPIPGAPPGKVMVSSSKTIIAQEIEDRVTRLYEEAKRRGPL